MQELKECEWFPAELHPVVSTLLSFIEIQDACFGWDLKEDWKEKIEIFTSMFKEMQTYSRARLELNLTVTWKICFLPYYPDRSVVWQDLQSTLEKQCMPG